MPELPEVETVRRGLEPVMGGATILRAEIRREGLRWPFPPGLAGRLEGQQVVALRRRSKYILAALSGGETLLLHLGMSGRILVSGGALGRFHHAEAAADRHDHVVLHLSGGARVTFNDARRFGALDLIPEGGEESHPLLAGLGPEPLGNAFSAEGLGERLAGKRTPVKAALLDQRVVAGLGNIYVSEALFRAGISPRRLAGNLGPTRLGRLVPAIRDVLSEAIEAGGSSLRDFRQADGELGYFQHAFRVYDREGQPCPHCGTGILRIVQSGRSSYFCPRCQH